MAGPARPGTIAAAQRSQEERVLKPAQTLDLDHLAAQTAGDKALQREILTLFASQSAEILAILGDPNAMPLARADLAHKLKGSARTVGAFALAEAAEATEAGLRAGNPAPAALKDLSGTAESALAAIRSHLSTLS
jgi:HPt (histidine-containing phosphotransfer) domain-containing protein